MLILVLSAVAFLAGVAVGTLFQVLVPGVFFVGTVLAFFWRPREAAVCLAFLLGVGRVQLFWQQTPGLSAEEFFEGTGVLQTDWGQKDGEATWLVDTDRGVFLLRCSAYEEWRMGDRVRLKGTVEPVELAARDSYLYYLQRYRVVGVMDKPRMDLDVAGSVSVLGALARLSTVLSERLAALLPEPESSFAVGLLLGQRQDMDPHLQEAFQTVGLTHIVAISGSNIALVVALFFAMFGFLRFQWRLFWSGAGVVFFVLLVGPSAAVLRAGLMGILTLLGLAQGRRTQVYFALLWSAVLMVLWNPLVLVRDIGFQLSFAATLGILTFVPILDRVFPRFPLREELILTLSAQIMTLPFIVFYFERVSWITPVANLAVAPLIPFAMAFSALALVFGPPAAALAWTSLWLIEKIALLCAAMPGVQIEITVSPLLFSVSLLGLSVFLLFSYRSKWGRAFLRDSSGFFSKE